MDQGIFMTYGYQPNRGFNVRIIIAIVIAIGAVVSYLGKRSVNPVTGRTEYVSMQPAQEIAMGLQAAPEMAAEMGGEVSTSDPRAAFVQQVGRRIVEKSDAGKP